YVSKPPIQSPSRFVGAAITCVAVHDKHDTMAATVRRALMVWLRFSALRPFRQGSARRDGSRSCLFIQGRVPVLTSCEWVLTYTCLGIRTGMEVSSSATKQ